MNKIKQTIQRINSNPIYAIMGFLLTLKELYNIMKIILASINNPNPNNFWELPIFSTSTLESILTIVILIQLWKMLNKYDEISEKMNVFNVINNIRNKRNFIKSYENVTHFRLPDETDEELWERLPQGGLYRDYLNEEFNIVKYKLQNIMKNKSIENIENLMRKYYPDYLFNNKKSFIGRGK